MGYGVSDSGCGVDTCMNILRKMHASKNLVIPYSRLLEFAVAQRYYPSFPFVLKQLLCSTLLERSACPRSRPMHHVSRSFQLPMKFARGFRFSFFPFFRTFHILSSLVSRIQLTCILTRKGYGTTSQGRKL